MKIVFPLLHGKGAHGKPFPLAEEASARLLRGGARRPVSRKSFPDQFLSQFQLRFSRFGLPVQLCGEDHAHHAAELRPGQKDQDSLPDYDTLDAILKLYLEENSSKQEIIAKGFAPEVVEKTLTLVNRNEYKRAQCPPILKVSKKAFGSGRRVPLVAKL